MDQINLKQDVIFEQVSRRPQKFHMTYFSTNTNPQPRVPTSIKSQIGNLATRGRQTKDYGHQTVESFKRNLNKPKMQ